MQCHLYILLNQCHQANQTAIVTFQFPKDPGGLVFVAAMNGSYCNNSTSVWKFTKESRIYLAKLLDFPEIRPFVGMFPYYPAIWFWKASVAMQESRRFHNKTTDHRCCDMPMQYAHPSSIYHHSHAGNESWCTVFMTVKALLESRLHVPPEIVAEIRSNHQHNAIFPIECDTSLHKKKKGSWSYSILCKSICFIHQVWETEHRTALKTKAMFQPSLCQWHYVYMHHIGHILAHRMPHFSVWDLGSKRSSKVPTKIFQE